MKTSNSPPGSYLENIDKKSLDYIYSLERFKKEFSLKSIKLFLKLAGSPEKELKIIHVAGTNGKGSVCRMLSTSLAGAGFKTGLFSSPHLVSFNERIQLNNQPISCAELEELVDKMKHLMARLKKEHNQELSFFEAATGMALLWFKMKKADYAVMETGMGGRLDATNAAAPVLSIITNISKDHCAVLGSSTESIAAEKAGIIKKNIAVVTGAKGRAFEVISQACKKKNARLVLPKLVQAINIPDIPVFQKENAAVACAALKELGIDEKYIKQGIERSYWPGRFDFLRANLLVDCAHNPAGIDALLHSLEIIRNQYEKIVFVFGAMQNKDVRAMAQKIERFRPHEIIITRPCMNNAVEPKQLAECFSGKTRIQTINQTEDALKKARASAGKKGLAVVAGSIFLAGNVFRLMRKNKLFMK